MLQKQKNISVWMEKVVICYILFTLFFGNLVLAKELPIQKPEVDPSSITKVTIDLEDESRFLGISMYQIADYTESGYKYCPEYEGLELRSFDKLSRESDKQAVIQDIQKYIDQEKIKAADMQKSIAGKVYFHNLSPGVYLFVQNEEDFNAKLKDSLYVQAPVWSAEDEQYLYEVNLVPKWDKVVWFSFRPEVVKPITYVLGLLICFSMCIFGSSVLQGAYVAGVSILFGLLGMNLGSMVNSSFLGLLVFFVTFAFMGLGAMLMLQKMLIEPLKKIRIYYWYVRNQFWIVPFIGAVGFGVLIYLVFIKKIWLVFLLVVLLGGLGIYLQYLRKDKIIKFYTYDDLIATDEKGEDV